MATFHTLQQELIALQQALAEDALDRLPEMIAAYHLHLHAWMSSAHRAAVEPESLRQLHALHNDLLHGLQQRQHHLHAQMQAERHNGRAARAYLANPA